MVAARRMLSFELPAARDRRRNRPLIVLLSPLEASRAALAFGAALAALAAALVAYRAGAQFMGWQAQGWPLSWAYGLGGLAVAPFHRFHAAPLANPAVAFDLANVIALEAFLILTAALLALLVAVSRLCQRYAALGRKVALNLTPARRACFDAAWVAERLLAGAEAAARRGASSTRAHLGSRRMA